MFFKIEQTYNFKFLSFALLVSIIKTKFMVVKEVGGF